MDGAGRRRTRPLGKVERRDQYGYDTSEAERDWEAHIKDVEARTVPLPTEVSCGSAWSSWSMTPPLAAVRAAGQMELMAAATGSPAAYLAVRGAEVSWRQIAEVPGPFVAGHGWAAQVAAAGDLL
ncbi:hypothetical protein [Streptomyces sp. NPDC055287]